MRVLLDTVTFVWALASPERLSKKAMAVLKDQKNIRLISAISLSEIAIKQTLGKLNFSRVDVSTGIVDLQARFLPYSAEHAYQLFDLPPHHSDPFDRQIISQALIEGIPVVTIDEKFELYVGLKVIW
jgi:PIN domain nuclease of toxin-antitoxin system